MKKNVLITGGNSGIGYAAARLFKERGYAVTIAGRNGARIEEAARQLGVDGHRADMGDGVDISRLAENFLADGLDVLVNNAAMARFLPLVAYSPEVYDESLNVNLRGPLELIRELVPALEKRSGAVVNISSAIVNNGAANAGIYAATKGAMDAYTKSLAIELAPQGIRVNAIAPGAIDTPIFGKIGLDKEQLAAIRTSHEATIPLRRYGTPAEVAQVIIAQAEASYVTGAIWEVDGGVSAS